MERTAKDTKDFANLCENLAASAVNLLLVPIRAFFISRGSVHYSSFLLSPEIKLYNAGIT